MEKFHSQTYGDLEYEEIIEKIALFIKADSNKQGDFVTAIVVHRIGKGGIYFWRRQLLPNMVAIADRIAKETQLSIELAWRLRDTFQHNGLSGYEPEVHLDVGEGGVTRDMIRWVTGMVLGSGLQYKIKPEAFGATKVADKHT